jgi:catechol 2,3-dioxygenase-like lactoylglutathione lyase family enzyme
MFRARYFAHANVNTADLPRAQAFYSTVLGLTPLGPTVPGEPQDGAPFDLAGQEVAWRGVFLADERGLRSPVVDLLEWTSPRTADPDPAEARAPGLRALGFAVGELAAAATALAGQHRPVRWCRAFLGDDGGRDLLLTSDLDGTPLELVQSPVAPRYESIRLACRDLAASTAFYRDALHLDCDEPADYRVEADGTVVESGRVARAYLPGQREKFWLNLTQPADAAGMPPSTRRGNTARLYRMALLTDDIDAAYRDLRRHLPETDPPTRAEVGSGNEPVPALFFRDPDGTVVEYLVGIWSARPAAAG